MLDISIYQSKGETELFAAKTLQQLSPIRPNTETNTVTIDEALTFQEIDGFGASFTDSSAYLIHQILEPEQRSQLMRALFDPKDGIGLSVLRNPMGASDYARDFYSYNDLPAGETDAELKRFSIAHDEEDIIPLLQEAVRLNPYIKLMASPWSPPGWMKTSGSMIGGELRRQYYSVYANYFVRYIKAYAANGLPIYAVTPQNEALYSPGHYPGMMMLPEAQIDFINNHLKPSFIEHHIDTKILCYDHNWDRADYPRTVLEQANAAVDGVAWHWYGGKPSAQTEIYEAFPDKEVHFTEGSGGEWIPPFEQAFSNVMRMGIEILRNYSKSFVLWNMALDEENGPFVPGFGNSTCRGIVKVDKRTKELTYTLDYYALAHFSTCIRPKAVCIASSASHDFIRSVAFKNTDDSIAVIMFNDSDELANIALKLQGEDPISFGLESKSAISFLIKRERFF
ncbi:glycoside hydrolase family 30 beta sandwich domain-containing protein [Cohnella sp. REN36]|uniref:glycoside hydrolase family 30 protein n=1 Tax=Cohnella sp. REN36 TaxID=2887347 RepID=UPI001D1402F2|nr:glycoside hydrolase family 30 beta sandwich domain-containing protein [Cohnella sp. REN36]MCC3376325.1 glycosyl hydrolase [Cohnella sp. REN36]